MSQLESSTGGHFQSGGTGVPRASDTDSRFPTSADRREKLADIRVVPLEEARLDDSASLFLNAGSGVLRALGKRFVREYLQWTIFGPLSVAALGAFTPDNRIVGLCVATRANSRDRFIAHRLPFVAGYAVSHPGLVFSPTLWRGVITVLRLKLLTQLRSNAPAQPSPADVRLLSIVVHPGFRGGGVARQLLEGCERILLSSGYERWGLVVSPSNRAALRLYERLGWVTVCPDGVWRGDMVKVIGVPTAKVSGEP